MSNDLVPRPPSSAKVREIYRRKKPEGPQEPPPVCASGRRRFFGNQYTRLSMFRRFMSGTSMWQLHIEYKIPMAAVEQAIRVELDRRDQTKAA